MDTNVIIAIVVAVVVIAAIIIGAWWFGKASKRSVERATDEAVAKGVQLATEDTEHAGQCRCRPYAACRSERGLG